VITEPVQADLDAVRRQAHHDCVVCSPSNDRGLGLTFRASEDGSVQACFQCHSAFEGYKGVLHGGVVVSLLDGAMTNCLFARGRSAVTAGLDVRFRHPVITNTPATVRAWVDRSTPPLHVLKAEVVQGEQVKATACGRFMEQSYLAAERPKDG